MKEKSLVILAAGMGSRFGGMKQVEPIGPNGEFIIDYSIYSALKYGFNKIVFVIKEEDYDLFKQTIGSRIKDRVKVCYAFQKLEDIPEGFSVPDGRKKPWGTAHAIYSARKYLKSKFGVITSDDFYGDEAFKQLSEHLNESDNHVIIGYNIGDTLSDNGEVKRGVIIHKNGVVERIIESACSMEGDKVKCVPLNSNVQTFYVKKNHPVSMLLNGFNHSILDTIGNSMRYEFENNKENLSSFEMLLPDIMDRDIECGKIIDVVPTVSMWIGMTYREDKEKLQKIILDNIDDGIYPRELWR